MQRKVVEKISFKGNSTLGCCWQNVECLTKLYTVIQIVVIYFALWNAAIMYPLLSLLVQKYWISELQHWEYCYKIHFFEKDVFCDIRRIKFQSFCFLDILALF